MNAILGSAVMTIALKATVVMVVSMLLLRIARRATASLRHSILAATFGVLLLLPIATMFVPERVVTVGTASLRKAVANAPFVGGNSLGSVLVTSPAAPPLNLGAVLVRVYLAGAGFFIISLIVGIARLQQIGRKARVSVAGTSLANEMARAERLSGGIEVAISSKLAVPVTFASAHPIILLPTPTDEWDPEDLGRALRHEIAHIARHDWLTQLLSRLACAIYWPHPFAWVLWRRLRLEAERACDDAVIRSSGDAESYAEQLVALARRLVARGSVPALAVAAPSKLGVRVEAILDRRVRRGPLTTLTSTGIAAVAVACMIAVAPFKLMSATNQQPAHRYESMDEADRLDVALFHAAEVGDVQVIRRYLDLGARANIAFSGDGTPLIAAARQGKVDAMRLLISAGADVNLGVDGDGNPLTLAAKHGYVDAVRLLLDEGADIDRGVEGDGNALIMAAGANQVEVVRYLLDRGASIEKVVRGDENPLIHASEGGALESARLLIERGANVNARVWVNEGESESGEWRTPLVMARRNHHDAVEALLLGAGAKQ